MNQWDRHSYLRDKSPAAETPGSGQGVGVADRDAPARRNGDDAGPIERDESRTPDESPREPVPAGYRGGPSRAGDEVAGFRILAVLGSGAEGFVYLATQKALADRPVVLKISSLQGGEHRSLARLQHTHIVPILSAQDLPKVGMRVLCLPYMGGTTLEQLLDELTDRPPYERSGSDLLEVLDRNAREAPLTLEASGPAREFLAVESYERAIAWIGVCLAEALHHAHVRGLVHWDVKPANVLLAADGMPLLLDFHLAQPPALVGMAPERLGGTPPYLAPEQFDALVAVCDGRRPPDVDERADIYALAMVLHVALAGKPPVGDLQVAARMRRANPRISPGLAAIVARGLERDPRRRYASAAHLAEDLRRHLEDEPLRGVSDRNPAERWRKWRRHNPLVLARVGAVVTALMSVMVAGLIAWSAADRRLRDAMGELERGQTLLAAGHHRQAALCFDHGLMLMDSGPRLDRVVPRAGEARSQLIAAKARNQTGQVAAELHDLAERVRFLYAGGATTPEAARKLEARLAEIWGARDAIHGQLTAEADEAARARIRADLLDLAILWADLRVGLADARGRPEAHREALRTLAKAEAEWGSSVVLVQEKRIHAEAIGRRDEFAPPPAGTGPNTAWECYALGRALLRHNDLDQAAAALDRAVALRPQSLWAQFYRGRCALRRERFEEAIDAFGACVALAPEAVCYYNRSLAYSGLGARERARLDLDRARELDPGLTALSPAARPSPALDD